MFFKVKQDAKLGEYVALGGMVFTKKQATNVPENLVDAARLLDFLEEVGRQPPPGVEENKANKPDEKFLKETSGLRPEEIVAKELERMEGPDSTELKSEIESVEGEMSQGVRKVEKKTKKEG